MSLKADRVAEGSESGVPPIVKEVSVPLDREHAFELFTARVGEWWPLPTHSIEGDAALDCVMEGRVGGRFYEQGPGDREHTWGTILEWDPPAAFAMTWHPGREESSAQRLEVSFVPAEGRTLVRLVHSGWERLADVGAAERDSYDGGWDYVLKFFTAAATA